MGFQRSLLPAAVLVLLLLAGGAAAQKCSIHAAARAKVAMEAEAAAAGSDELTVLAAALAGRATAATAETAAAAAEPQQTAAGLARGDLPKRRPRQPWPYRALSTALSAPKPATDSKGVTSIVVEHAPLTNVTVRASPSHASPSIPARASGAHGWPCPRTPTPTCARLRRPTC